MMRGDTILLWLTPREKLVNVVCLEVGLSKYLTLPPCDCDSDNLNLWKFMPRRILYSGCTCVADILLCSLQLCHWWINMAVLNTAKELLCKLTVRMTVVCVVSAVFQKVDFCYETQNCSFPSFSNLCGLFLCLPLPICFSIISFFLFILLCISPLEPRPCRTWRDPSHLLHGCQHYFLENPHHCLPRCDTT